MSAATIDQRYVDETSFSGPGPDVWLGRSRERRQELLMQRPVWEKEELRLATWGRQDTEGRRGAPRALGFAWASSRGSSGPSHNGADAGGRTGQRAPRLRGCDAARMLRAESRATTRCELPGTARPPSLGLNGPALASFKGKHFWNACCIPSPLLGTVYS